MNSVGITGDCKQLLSRISRWPALALASGLLIACVSGNPYIGSRVSPSTTTSSYQCVPGRAECAVNMGTFVFRYRVTARGDGHLLHGVVVRPNYGDYDAVQSRRHGALKSPATMTVNGQLFLVHTGLIVDSVPFSSSGPHNLPMMFVKEFKAGAKFQTAFIGQHETYLHAKANVQ